MSDVFATTAPTTFQEANERVAALFRGESVNIDELNAASAARDGIAARAEAERKEAARQRALKDVRFPALALIMHAGAGLLVSKPGTRLTCWVPNTEIHYMHTLETLGEVRADRPNGRAVRYSVQVFDVTPAGQRILQRNGLI